jgi:hypothetical protein
MDEVNLVKYPVETTKVLFGGFRLEKDKISTIN